MRKCSQYRAVMLRYCVFLSPISPLIRERQPRANAKAEGPSTHQSSVVVAFRPYDCSVACFESVIHVIRIG
jgi:hypothetical protein